MIDGTYKHDGIDNGNLRRFTKTIRARTFWNFVVILKFESDQ